MQSQQKVAWKHTAYTDVGSYRREVPKPALTDFPESSLPFLTQICTKTLNLTVIQKHNGYINRGLTPQMVLPPVRKTQKPPHQAPRQLSTLKDYGDGATTYFVTFLALPLRNRRHELQFYNI